jgi:hypothetical protein
LSFSAQRFGRDDPAVAWLLESGDPSIRYLTLVDVLGESPSAPAAAQARADIPNGARVRALLRGQRRDGSFGVPAYKKWVGAHWRLVALAELAYPCDERARAAIDHVVAWLRSPRHVASIRTITDRVRQHASQEGNALGACCTFGLGHDERVSALADSLARSQWPDGGWNCDPRPEASHSSFYESITPLWGLAEHARATGNERSSAAAARASEFFLRHRLFRSCTTEEVADERWLKLRYPLYWHYDILHGLLVLSRSGRVHDDRAREAVGIVAHKRRADGCWRAEGYYWSPPGAAARNPDVVDWGRGGPNEFITLNALRVLNAAARRPADANA